MVEGREFRDDDWSPMASKVIVNQSFARQHFPGATAIGHHLQWSEWKDLEIIGVVADSKEQPGEKVRRAFYLPIDTGGFGASTMVLLVRSTREPAAVLAAARGVLARIDPQLAPYRCRQPRRSHRAFRRVAQTLRARLALVCARGAGARGGGLYGVCPTPWDPGRGSSGSASRSAPKRARCDGRCFGKGWC